MKKIEDFGNARSPSDKHPFPTKQMQHKTVKRQSNVPVINEKGTAKHQDTGNGDWSKRVRETDGGWGEGGSVIVESEGECSGRV